MKIMSMTKKEEIVNFEKKKKQITSNKLKKLKHTCDKAEGSDNDISSIIVCGSVTSGEAGAE